jgi:FtsP/CotA-like multicopper oxidase with cupredoxin domain
MALDQVARRSYAPLILQGRDDIEVDQELVLMMDDWQLDENTQIDEAFFRNMRDRSHNVRLGNWFTINGRLQLQFPISGESYSRLRLINAANARILRLKLEGAQVGVI